MGKSRIVRNVGMATRKMILFFQSGKHHMRPTTILRRVPPRDRSRALWSYFRRLVSQGCLGILFHCIFHWNCFSGSLFANEVERWGLFELALDGPSSGNPFTDVDISARFRHAKHDLEVHGFYDGNGKYLVRFSPDELGEWTYETHSNRQELQSKKGSLRVVAPSKSNRGPVVVRDRFHFAYADGTPYFPIGTTCYAWTHQSEVLETQTLLTLKSSPFNKLRMCIFPKNYDYNQNDPPRYPFVGKPPKDWDFSRFEPEFFRHLERRIVQLQEQGIEADLILFHPYDKGRWGFDRMSSDSDDRYLKYAIARLSAFRNVWWSLANEFDFMLEKKITDWDRFLDIVNTRDPHRRLCSIHNGREIYNQNKQGLTHASIQNGSAVADFGRAVLYRDVYRKPIVFDEVKYEGDIEQRWGNLSAEEMVHRFWQGTIAGTYVGHGETYRNTESIIWWARGGELHGKSPSRIAFLRKILEDGPPTAWEPIDKWQDFRTAGKKGEFYFVYFGKETPSEWKVTLPCDGFLEPMRLKAEIIDTWEMTIEPVDGFFEMVPDGKYVFRCTNRTSLPLPGKPYIAIRLKRAS